MPLSLRRYWTTLAVLSLVLPVIAFYYARNLAVPGYITVAVVAAFLVEIAFYILPGFAGTTARIRRFDDTHGPYALAGVFTLSGVVPYSVFAALSGSFQVKQLLMVAALAALVSFWFALLPRHPIFDLLFLVVMCVVYLSPVFRLAAPPLEAAPKIPVDFFARLMWIRLGIASALFLRRAEDVGFGFWPNRLEWKVGLLHYLYFLPFAFGINLLVGFVRLRPWPVDYTRLLLVALATFLGMLWVTVLSEEFFFRGLLQQWLQKWTGKPAIALVLTSILFGLAHLPYPPGFPNWRMVALASVAGLFYGRAFQQGKSIRAAMVTHTLVNVTWRVFFY